MPLPERVLPPKLLIATSKKALNIISSNKVYILPDHKATKVHDKEKAHIGNVKKDDYLLLNISELNARKHLWVKVNSVYYDKTQDLTLAFGNTW